MGTRILIPWNAVHRRRGSRKEEQSRNPRRSFIPSAKELDEVMESKARSQKALIDLAAAEREQRVLGYLDFLANDFDTKIADAKKRGAVLNRTAYFDRPSGVRRREPARSR